LKTSAFGLAWSVGGSFTVRTTSPETVVAPELETVRDAEYTPGPSPAGLAVRDRVAGVVPVPVVRVSQFALLVEAATETAPALLVIPNVCCTAGPPVVALTKTIPGLRESVFCASTQGASRNSEEMTRGRQEAWERDITFGQWAATVPL
jgi:hypothetical protein